MEFQTCRRWVLTLAAGLLGCVAPPAGSDEGSSDVTGTAEPAEGSTTGEVSATSVVTTAVGSTSSDAGDDSSSDDGGWPCGSPGGEERIAHCPPDGGGLTWECDLLAQDCAVGEKCMPWSNDGGAAWNATRCSPIAPQPDPLGSPCMVEGSGVSGIDSCELGAQCWHVDPATNEGVCVPMCSGALEDVFCEDPDDVCMTSNDGAILLCLPGCDPLQGCEAAGELCVPEPSGGFFACVPASGEPAADGEACEYLNVCAPGSTCVAAEAVGCEGSSGCCTPLCDITAPACALSGTECVPWYPEGQRPRIHPFLGVCSLVPEPTNEWPGSDQVRADF